MYNMLELMYKVHQSQVLKSDLKIFNKHQAINLKSHLKKQTGESSVRYNNNNGYLEFDETFHTLSSTDFPYLANKSIIVL